MLELKRFHAAWCAPCKALAPTINEVKSSFTGVSFSEVDIDEDYEAATKYGIRSVPTVVVLKDGNEVQRIVGNQPKQIYVDALNKNLS